MNNIIVQSEVELLDVLRQILANWNIPGLKLADFVVAPRSAVDALITFELDKQALRFAVVAKLNATAVTLAQLTALAGSSSTPPLLVTVRLPESLAQKCREAGISHVDLNGRVWLRCPGLLMDRNVPNPTVRYQLADPEVDFFSPKSSRLARVLLSYPDRSWRQADLATSTQLSQGLVSRLLTHASKIGWVEGSRGDWRLVDRNAALDAWEKADVWRKRVTVRQYFALDAELTALARHVLDGAVGDIAFTQWFAANLRYPYTQPPVVSAYRRQLLTAEEQQGLGVREVSDGGRLWILVPRDEGVFQTVRRVDGFPLVCDAQIYLDLLQVGLRGPDQAKALREWKGFGQS